MTIYTEFLQEAAKEAGPIWRKHWKKAETIAHTLKLDRTPVTLADTETSAAVKACFQREFPNGVFRCEEAGYDPLGEEDVILLLDPIDGTQRFLEGGQEAVFGAAIFDRRLNPDYPQGVIAHAPLFDRPLTFTTSADRKGAYCNGERIETSKETSGPLRIIVGTGNPTPYPEELYNSVGLTADLKSEGFEVEMMHSSILSCAEVACGRVHAAFFPWKKPHDMIGTHLVEVAGGFVSTLLVQDRINLLDDQIEGYLVAGSNALYERLYRIERRHRRHIFPTT